jgi:hypothetical protein
MFEATAAEFLVNFVVSDTRKVRIHFVKELTKLWDWLSIISKKGNKEHWETE